MLTKIFKLKKDDALAGVRAAAPCKCEDETRSFLLQRELEKTKAGILVLVELSGMNDMEIYKKYQYSRWNEISDLESRYLKKRYFLKSAHPYYISVPFMHKGETVGQTFERYDFQNKSNVKKSLYDFTQSQLSEMFEAMIEVINKKKETECQNATE